MIISQDVTNAGVGWCVSGKLDTVFDGDTDGITIGLDKIIELDFSENFLSVVMMERFRVLLKESKMSSMIA